MSLTPGWTEKSKDHSIGIQALTCELIRFNGASYFLDNGSEFKEYPRTKAGWADLCDDLKEFLP